jgi:hypothetical protein
MQEFTDDVKEETMWTRKWNCKARQCEQENEIAKQDNANKKMKLQSKTIFSLYLDISDKRRGERSDWKDATDNECYKMEREME